MFAGWESDARAATHTALLNGTGWDWECTAIQGRFPHPEDVSEVLSAAASYGM